MDPIAWDIRYGLPEKKYQEYLRFINQWWQLKERVYIDPLAINAPPDKIELAYIERVEVEEQIYGQGCKIIVGTMGSGKTTLWRKNRSAKDTSGRDMSFVRMSPDILTSTCLAHHQLDKRVKILVDGTEHLNEESLVHLICTTQQWHTKAPGLLDFVVFVDRERKSLVKGLDCVKKGNVAVYELPPWQESELQALLGQRLVAWRPGIIDYTGFKGAPGIPSKINVKLRKILQKFNAFKSDDELRSIFVDDRIIFCRDELPEASDRESRISKTIDHLWKCENVQHENGLILFLCVLSEPIDFNDIRKQQLIQLIKNLESVWCPSRLSSANLVSSDYELNWAMDIPGFEDDEARNEFISIILKGALRAKPERGGFDAPIHAFNLARGLIAACAGCWTKRYPPPLSVPHLQSIVDIYWGEGGAE